MKNLLKKYHKWYLLHEKEKSCIKSVLMWLCIWLILTQLIPFGCWTHLLKKKRFTFFSTYSPELISASILRCQTGFPSKNKCLIQSLVYWSLLSNHNDLHFIIGVQKNTLNQFEAHAWVKNQTEILIGKRPFDQFIPIWSHSQIKKHET